MGYQREYQAIRTQFKPFPFGQHRNGKHFDISRLEPRLRISLGRNGLAWLKGDLYTGDACTSCVYIVHCTIQEYNCYTMTPAHFNGPDCNTLSLSLGCNGSPVIERESERDCKTPVHREIEVRLPSIKKVRWIKLDDGLFWKIKQSNFTLAVHGTACSAAGTHKSCTSQWIWDSHQMHKLKRV